MLPLKSSLHGFIDQSIADFKQAGLRVPDGLLVRFGAALLAKRFLILTGLSGSGKTKLAQAFAAWLTPVISHCDPFIPGAKIKSDRITYIVRSSDRIAVEFSNNEDDAHETLVLLPRALIAEWASYISSNHLERNVLARTIREGVSPTSRYSAQLHSFETHLKAAAFALLGAEESNQQHSFYRVIAVGADWTTNENVVGYMDALQDKIYRKPSNGALDVILRAELDPARPYFLILDEMNLSHVERYFADILSAIESGQEIALHASAESLKSSEHDTLLVPPKISLPKNLFIIGTVNVDETTYMFSPKVLDRANVIEFRAKADDIAAFLDAPSAVNMELLEGKGAAFGAAFVAEAAAEVQLKSATAAELKARLAEVFAALAPIGAEFGFRTAYEITRFTHYHDKLTGAGWQFNDALDAQVLQKLMPKLHGSQRRLEPVLKALEVFCTTHQCNASLEKIKRMQDRLKDGFASFAEA
jgi:energy-coupling factor transporter ATP-binding protein EcfA2